MGYFTKKQLKCKIFDKRLMNITLEEQVNTFFVGVGDIDIVYISKDEESVIIVYR